MTRKSERIPNGTWSDLDLAMRITMELRGALGRFPTASDFRAHRHDGLLDAIYRVHGGLRAMRNLCGVDQSSTAPGYWRDYDHIRAAVESWMAAHGTFPSKRSLEKAGRNDLAVAICRHHGGYHSLRRKMGIEEKASRLPMGHWQDRDNVVSAINGLIDALGHFPSQEEMVDHGQKSLAAAINKWHGGLNRMRGEMGFDQRRLPNGHYDAFENLAAALGPVIADLGRFPTHLELIERHVSSLSPAIKRHGGFPVVRERMGYVPVTDETLSACADALIPVVIAFDLGETRAFWTAMKRRWTRKDLDAALAAFEKDGTLDAFRRLLADP